MGPITQTVRRTGKRHSTGLATDRVVASVRDHGVSDNGMLHAYRNPTRVFELVLIGRTRIPGEHIVTGRRRRDPRRSADPGRSLI